jgi:hypothetical protein
MNTPYVYSAPATSVPNLSAQGAITWVQGEAGARSINVAPGQTALLMDSEKNVFYIKSSDAAGIPLPLRTFKYEETSVMPQKDDPALSTYITKEELDKRLEEFARQLQQPQEQPEIKEDNNNGKFDF